MALNVNLMATDSGTGTKTKAPKQNLQAVKPSAIHYNTPTRSLGASAAQGLSGGGQAYQAYQANKSSGGGTGGGGGSSASAAAVAAPAYEGGYEGGYYEGGGGYDATSVWMEYLNRLQAQAQQAYERNMKRIREAYDSAAGSLKSNLNSTNDQLRASFNKSQGGINYDAERALQQAYINNQLSQRDLAQALTAQGLTGGASETTQASLRNSYGNSRNAIETERNGNLSDLNLNYNNNLSSALQAYNSAKANLDLQRMQQEQQAENALTNFMSGFAGNLSSLAVGDDTYLAALEALANQQNGLSYSINGPTNTPTSYNVQQADAAQSTNYAKWLQSVAQQRAAGTSAQAIKQSLYQQAAKGSLSLSEIADIMARSGIA